MLLLTKSQVKHIARLANLTLTDGEVKKFQQQLSDILQYVEKLRKVNTKGIKPTSQVTGLKNVIRKDKVNKSRYTSYEGYYKTKAIF